MVTTVMNKVISDEERVEARKAPLGNKMLKDKVAVIYGAAGAIGSTSKLNKVAEEITSAGLSAEVAVLNLTGGKISD